MKKISLTILLIIWTLGLLIGQGIYYRPIISFQYNTLSGNNADMVQSTPKAFGYGLYDCSQKIGITHIFTKKAKRIFTGIDFPIINITKIRFKNNITFSDSKIVIDTNPNHTYFSKFFSSDGSKLTLISLNLSFYIGYKIQKIKNSYLRFGVFSEYYLTGWNKLIFHEEGKRKVLQTNFDNIRKAGLQNFNYGVMVGLRLKQFYIFYEHSFSNLLKTTQFNAHLNSYGIFYFLSLNSLRSKKTIQI